jgi:hypothetical protein
VIAHADERPTCTAPGADGRRVVAMRPVLVGAVALLATLAPMRWAHSRAARPTTADAAEMVVSLGRRASHGHRYHAAVVATTPLAIGVRQRWTVQLTRRGHRRVVGARLTARSWSPATGEIAPIAPRVRYVGRGRYLLDDVYFPRPGWWNVALVIDAAGGGAAGTDSVAFNVILPARGDGTRRSAGGPRPPSSARTPPSSGPPVGARAADTMR